MDMHLISDGSLYKTNNQQSLNSTFPKHPLAACCFSFETQHSSHLISESITGDMGVNFGVWEKLGTITKEKVYI